MKSINTFYLVLIVLITLASACKETKQENTEKQAVKTEIDRTGPLSDEEKAHYTSVGKSISQATFQVMSKNLQEALAHGGVQEAASYCNVVALKLTDSLSQVHNARIKRSSLKLRNKDNLPNEDERKMLTKYQEDLDNDLQISPLVVASEPDSVQFFSPIFTKALCLTCHGIKGKELNEKDYALIAKLYPDDEAIGYQENDFRAIWSIKMLRNWEANSSE
jgi:hypothetical protein